MWNGTALILKARPAKTNTMPNSSPIEQAITAWRWRCLRKLVVPVKP
jgi:hypothetical protein